MRLIEDQRDLAKDFGQLYVPNVNNQLIRIKNIAEPLVTTGPSKIYRRDRSRYIAITGNLDQHGAIGKSLAPAPWIRRPPVTGAKSPGLNPASRGEGP